MKMSSSLKKLSSGERINSAADDAAGLAISEYLKGKIRSARQASRNGQDGVSMLQVAEGGLQEISNILIRMRELSMQTATDTLNENSKGLADLEYQNLKEEIDRIAKNTEFTGKKLLDGSTPVLEVQVGGKNQSLDRITLDPKTFTVTLKGLNLSSSSIATKLGSQEALDLVDSSIVQIAGARAEIGAKQNRLQSTINNLAVQTENMEDSKSKIRDTDFARQSSDLTKNKILTNTNIMVLTQANNSPTAAVRLISDTEGSSVR
jgi:flagellin